MKKTAVSYLNTYYMIADFLTKTVTHEKLLWTLGKINVMDVNLIEIKNQDIIYNNNTRRKGSEGR